MFGEGKMYDNVLKKVKNRVNLKFFSRFIFDPKMTKFELKCDLFLLKSVKNYIFLLKKWVVFWEIRKIIVSL